MSGTDCVDPDTGSGEGLVVVLRRPVDLGRGGTSPRLPTIEAPVAADGTFSGSGTIAQPLFPDGMQTAVATCERPNPVEADIQDFSGRDVEVTIVAPALPDLRVQAGASFGLVLPCAILGGSYGFFRLSLTTGGQPDINLAVPGRFPKGTSPQQGDTVNIEVPASAASGTYDATARCGVSQGGTGAYYAGFTVTITAAADQVVDSAPSATALGGEAQFTG